MKISDTASSLALTAFGGFTAWQAKKLSIGSVHEPGPGFFPFCLGLLLVAVAVAIFFGGLKQKDAPPEKGLRRDRVIITLISFFVYAYIMEPLGYLLSTFLLMVLLLRMTVKKAWWYAPAVGVLVSGVSYLLFSVWLEVRMPGWPAGF